jgi:hypothetical protein
LFNLREEILFTKEMPGAVAVLIEKDKESRLVPLFTELFSGDRSTVANSSACKFFV